LILVAAAGALASGQHVDSAALSEDQRFDYRVSVRTETETALGVEMVEQVYWLQCVVARVGDDGGAVVGARVWRVQSELVRDDETRRLDVTLEADGTATASATDERLEHVGERLVQSEFALLCDETGRVVQVIGLEGVIGAMGEIDGASVLLGALHPSALGSLLTPIFALDGAGQTEEGEWETGSSLVLGEGRRLDRTIRWRVDDRVEGGVTVLAGAIDAELEQASRRSDLSPTGTIDAFEGSVEARLDSSMIERVASESMTITWRVDSIERGAQTETTRRLERLDDVALITAPARQAEERSEQRRMDPDGDG
jgi:hypothetical protein